MSSDPSTSAADETPDQAALDSINAVVEHARPDEDFGTGLAQGSAARYPKPPLGRVPVLPPTHICRDHDGDRFSGEPCPNCLPIHARPGIAHEPCFQDGHSHDWRDCPTPILAASADVADLDATREVEDV